MATNTWTGGAGDNLWTSAGNWTGGAEPSTGDDVIFDRGNSSVAGIDKSAVNLASLTITDGYTGTFGTSAANPVKVAVSGQCRIRPGSGLDSANQQNAIYLNSGGTNPIANLTVAPASPSVKIDLGGTITTAWLLSGQISSAASYTTLFTEARDSNDLNLTCTWTGGTITTAHLFGGYHNVAAATTFTTTTHCCGTIDNYKGTFTTLTMIQMRAQRFNHRHTATITTATARPNAVFDGTKDSRAKTITNFTRHHGAVVLLDPNTTVTNNVLDPLGVAMREYGGGGNSFST